jgi:Putative Flp pilus-assembly TadE/G-like
MRRLTERDDTGATMILVSLCLVFLIGFVALALDVGALVQERRVLQNGADAAALAVATDCAKGACGPYTNTALSYANANADDGQADASVVFPTSSSVEVTTTTRSNAGNTVEFLFAPVMGGDDGKTVTRKATAQWGAIGSGATIPLIISSCEFSLSRLDGSADIVLYMDSGPSCGLPGSPPGGFGWLDQSGCAVPVAANSTVPGTTGVSSHGGEACVIQNLNTDILVPIYDAYVGNGSHATYTVAGFATFRLSGYSFNGNDFGGTLGKQCPDEQTRGKYCIKGDFIRFSTQQGTIGGGQDFGSYAVRGCPDRRGTWVMVPSVRLRADRTRRVCQGS